MSNKYKKLITFSFGLVLVASMSAFAQRGGGERSGGSRSGNAGGISRPGRSEGMPSRQFNTPPSAGSFHQNSSPGFTPRNPSPSSPRQPFAGNTPRPGTTISRPPSSSFNNRGSNFYGNRYTGPRTVNNYNYRGSNYRYGSRPNYRFYYGGAYHPHPVYYRPFTRPTFGVRISILPRGYYPFYVGPNRYFFDNGSYYRYYDNYYVTVAPPYGAVVPVLPGGAVLVPIGGRNYYEYTGTYYEPRVDAYGATTYAVVGTDGVLQQDRDSADIISDESIQSNMDNADRPITELPSSFKTVTLDNKTYYVSPSGDYYVKNIDEDGKVTYQLTTKAQ